MKTNDLRGECVKHNMKIFVFVEKIPSLRPVLLNSKQHFSLMVTFAETFFISRTDSRHSDESGKIREPRDPADMLKNPEIEE